MDEKVGEVSLVSQVYQLHQPAENLVMKVYQGRMASLD